MPAELNPQVADLVASIPVKNVLRVVKEHQQLLEEVHQDARRLALGGAPPAYLVDFDLLYSFMWPESASEPAVVAETTYLFEHGENFIIGPGTLHELEHALHDLIGDNLHEPLSDEALTRISMVETFVAEMEDRLHRLLSSRASGEGIARFNDLLREGRFMLYSQCADFVDQQAFREARVYLSRRRPGRSRGQVNIADALNFAAVAHLRSVGHRLNPAIFPYLLTGTRVMLDLPAAPMDEDEESEAPSLTRSTKSAIYGNVLFSRLEPKEAADYTVSKAFDLASVARDLRTLPTYYASAPTADAGAYREHASQVAAVFRDPIIDESQKILDNILLTEGAAAGAAEGRPTARYVLDQVVQLARLLEMRRTDDEMWTEAYLLEDFKEGRKGVHAVQAFSSSHEGTSEGNWLFECARYSDISITGMTEPFYVFRWPGRLDAPRILRLFSKSLLRHDVNECRLYVGTEDNRVAYDDVTLPFDWHEIADALPTSPRWLRASSEPFDLYADLWSPLIRDPFIGVFTSEPNTEHIASLFYESGGRFLFAGWARAMFRRAVEMVP